MLASNRVLSLKEDSKGNIWVATRDAGLFLYDEKTDKFKQFLTDGYFLQIRGRVGERFKKEGDWEFKITSIDLLSELRDKLTKSITIQLPIELVTDNFMEKIDEILTQNKTESERHNCKLNFAVYDKEKGILLELPSNSLKINPNNNFLAQLNKWNNISYKLN